MHEYASVTLAKMRSVHPLEPGPRAGSENARSATRRLLGVDISTALYVLPFEFSFHIRTGTGFNRRLSLAMPLPSHPGPERLSKLQGFRRRREGSSSCRKTDELHRHARR